MNTTTERAEKLGPVCGRSFPGVGSDKDEAEVHAHSAFHAHLSLSPQCRR
jgi:hypothetical protein